MSRRGSSRRAGRWPASAAVINPAIALAADFAWRADGASTSGGLVTQWNPYRGVVALAQASGAARAAAPATSAFLGGRLSVAFTSDYYTGTLALGDSQTVATAVYVPSNTLKGIWSSSNGTINVGTSLLVSTNIQARRNGNTDGLQTTNITSIAGIAIAVLTTGASRFYFNALTPFTTASAAASIAQSGHALGALTSAGGQPFTGEIAEHACWNRALSVTECAILMRGWGRYYGQVIAP